MNSSSSDRNDIWDSCFFLFSLVIACILMGMFVKLQEILFFGKLGFLGVFFLELLANTC